MRSRPSRRTGTTGTSSRAAIMAAPGWKRAISPCCGSPAFGIDQDREAVADQVADVAQGLARAAFALRQRESVEEERREVVVRAVLDVRLPAELLRIEVRLEELLRHGRCDAVTPARRERVEDDRRVEVALVIGGEDHRTRRGVRGAPARAPRRWRRSGRGAESRSAGWRGAGRARAAIGSTTGSRSPRLRPPLPGRPRRAAGQRVEVGDGPRGAEARLVDGDLERLFERHHQLDAFERAQPERVDRRCRGSACVRARTAASTDATRSRNLWRLPASAGPARRCSHALSSRRFSLRVPSVRGSSRPGQTAAARTF